MVTFLVGKDLTNEKGESQATIYLIINILAVLYNILFFVVFIYHWVSSLIAWHIHTLQKFNITYKILRCF
jgi:hypothetical protein